MCDIINISFNELKLIGVKDMLDKSDLQAIQALIQASLQESLKPINERLDRLESEQLKTRVALETTIDKCIQVLWEGHQLNAERFDRLDIESIKLKADEALVLSKLLNEKVERILDKESA